MGITGLILSILGLVLTAIPVLGIILAIEGLILSIIALKKSSQKGIEIAGIVVASIAIIGGIIVNIAFAFILYLQMALNTPIQ